MAERTNLYGVALNILVFVAGLVYAAVGIGVIAGSIVGMITPSVAALVPIWVAIIGISFGTLVLGAGTGGIWAACTKGPQRWGSSTFGSFQCITCIIFTLSTVIAVVAFVGLGTLSSSAQELDLRHFDQVGGVMMDVIEFGSLALYRGCVGGDTAFAARQELGTGVEAIPIAFSPAAPPPLPAAPFNASAALFAPPPPSVPANFPSPPMSPPIPFIVTVTGAMSIFQLKDGLFESYEAAFTAALSTELGVAAEQISVSAGGSLLMIDVDVSVEAVANGTLGESTDAVAASIFSQFQALASLASSPTGSSATQNAQLRLGLPLENFTLQTGMTVQPPRTNFLLPPPPPPPIAPIQEVFLELTCVEEFKGFETLVNGACLGPNFAVKADVLRDPVLNGTLECYLSEDFGWPPPDLEEVIERGDVVAWEKFLFCHCSNVWLDQFNQEIELVRDVSMSLAIFTVIIMLGLCFKGCNCSLRNCLSEVTCFGMCPSGLMSKQSGVKYEGSEVGARTSAV